MSLLFSFCVLSSLPAWSETEKPSDCFQEKGFETLSERLHLFIPLNSAEKKRRTAIDLPLYPSEDYPQSETVLNSLITAYNQAKPNAHYIPVDLRHYRSVDLSDFIISNLPEKHLNLKFLKKKTYFSQGFFLLVNLNTQGLRLILGHKIHPPVRQDLIKEIKDRRDLANSEIILNFNQPSPSSLSCLPILTGNLKLSGDKKKSMNISILADGFCLNPETGTGGIRLDIRQVVKPIFGFSQQARWQMPLYSLENSAIHNGKLTEGIMNFIYNKKTHPAVFQEFQVKDFCYYDKTHPFHD